MKVDDEDGNNDGERGDKNFNDNDFRGKDDDDDNYGLEVGYKNVKIMISGGKMMMMTMMKMTMMKERREARMMTWIQMIQIRLSSGK